MDTILSRNANFVMDTPTEFLLKNELLYKEDEISNGCYLMFCKDDNLYSSIQMGHFASEIVIKDDQSDSGDIIGQIEEVMSFVRKHINKALIISDKQIENIQRWQYPLDGIRELVLNMIIHRDYTSSFDSQIKVFANHILFFNPGGLPDSITIEQLLTNNYVSTPRNRQIAKTVKEMGLIERYGTGIKRVRRMFIEYGLPEPRFEIIPGGFAVTVFATTENNVNEPANEPVNEPANDVTDNVTDNVTDKLGDLKSDLKSDLKGDDIEAKIIDTIFADNKITIPQLSQLIGRGITVTKQYITKLKVSGKIKRIGPDKGGHWEVIAL